MSVWRNDSGVAREFALLRNDGSTAYHQSVPFSAAVISQRMDADSSLNGEVVSRVVSFGDWRSSSRRSK